MSRLLRHQIPSPLGLGPHPLTGRILRPLKPHTNALACGLVSDPLNALSRNGFRW